MPITDHEANIAPMTNDDDEVLSAEESAYDGIDQVLDESDDKWGRHTQIVGFSRFGRVCLRSLVYREDDPKHDFKLMVMNPAYKDTLIIYAENYFCWRNPEFQQCGGGSAILRPFVAGTMQSAGAFVAGVVTGLSADVGGFPNFDSFAAEIIDLCFYNILNILRRNNGIRNVVFACNPLERTSFGTSIFKVNETVIKYINGKLVDLLIHVDNPKFSSLSWVKIERKCTFHLDRIAVLNYNQSRNAIQLSRVRQWIKNGDNVTADNVVKVLDRISMEEEHRKKYSDVSIAEWLEQVKAHPTK